MHAVGIKNEYTDPKCTETETEKKNEAFCFRTSGKRQLGRRGNNIIMDP